MFGGPASPPALTRHILDYPLDDGTFEFVQRDVSPPKRPNRASFQSSPILRCLDRRPKPPPFSPTALQTLMAMFRRTEETVSSPDSNAPLLASPPTPPSAPAREPTTPAPAERVPRQHPFSPKTPSRLSITASDDRATSRSATTRSSRSPYVPMYLIPRREQLDLLPLIKQKSLYIQKVGELRSPVLRSTRTPSLSRRIGSPLSLPRTTSSSSSPSPRPHVPLADVQKMLALKAAASPPALNVRTTLTYKARIETDASRLKRPFSDTSPSPDQSPIKPDEKSPRLGSPPNPAPAQRAVTTRGLISEMWQSSEVETPMDIDTPEPAETGSRELEEGQGPKSNLYQDKLRSLRLEPESAPSTPAPPCLEGPLLLPFSPEDEAEMEANEVIRLQAMEFFSSRLQVTPPSSDGDTAAEKQYSDPVAKFQELRALNNRPPPKPDSPAPVIQNDDIHSAGSKAQVLEITRLKYMIRPHVRSEKPKKKSDKVIKDLCAWTRQKNFAKAVFDRVSPDSEPATEESTPWWSRGSIETSDKQENSDNQERAPVDAAGWPLQVAGVGLGLGLGIAQHSLESPKTYPKHKHPATLMAESGIGMSHMSGDNLHRNMGLRENHDITTPSPPTPDIVTPEFDDDAGQIRGVNKAWPRPTRGTSGKHRSHREKDSQRLDDLLEEEEDDEDLPLRPRYGKRDKGKGRAMAPSPESSPTSTPNPVYENDGFDLDKAIMVYGVEIAEELQMEYAIEMSKTRTTMAEYEEAQLNCGDSPGASGSGSSAQMSWTDSDAEGEEDDMETDMSHWSSDEEDEDMDIEMEDDFATPTARSPPRMVRSGPSTPPTVRAPIRAAQALRDAMMDQSPQDEGRSGILAGAPLLQSPPHEKSKPIPIPIPAANRLQDRTEKEIRTQFADLDIKDLNNYYGVLSPGCALVDWRLCQSPAYYAAEAAKASKNLKWQHGTSGRIDTEDDDDMNGSNDKHDDKDNRDDKHDWFVVKPPSPSLTMTPRLSVPDVTRTSPSPEGGIPAWLRPATPRKEEVDTSRLMPPSPNTATKRRRNSRKGNTTPTSEVSPSAPPQTESGEHSKGLATAWESKWTPSRRAPSVPSNEAPASNASAWADSMRRALSRLPEGGASSSILADGAEVMHVEDVDEAKKGKRDKIRSA